MLSHRALAEDDQAPLQAAHARRGVEQGYVLGGHHHAAGALRILRILNDYFKMVMYNSNHERWVIADLSPAGEGTFRSSPIAAESATDADGGSSSVCLRVPFDHNATYIGRCDP